MRRALLGALLTAAALASLHAQDPKKVDTSPKAVVAAAVAYVAGYEKDMAFVLADEVATQRVVTSASELIAIRRTLAEFFLTYLPTEGTWISVRDVYSVDGARVTDVDDIRSLIQRAPLGRLGSIIAEKNARFNIGNIRRTFNEPTIGLLIVSAVHQRRFKFERVDVVPGASPKVTLKFTERDRPTLIVGVRGEPVYTRGELGVDAATGRIERTRVEMTLGAVHAVLSTTYALDGKLNLWIPAVMSERYENTSPVFRQTITVDAAYTNYRRFDSTVIIK